MDISAPFSRTSPRLAPAAPARPAFAAAATPTLADVRTAVAAAPDLTPAQRRDLLSALNVFARAAGVGLERLPAHPGALGQRLKAMRPAAADIQPRRWQNVVSLVRSALELAGLAVMPGRYQVPFSPAWRALNKALPDRGLRDKLSRLGHYCSASGVEPDQVADAVLAAFRRALIDEAVIEHPEKTFKVAVTAWNTAATLFPERGLTAVTPVTLSRDYVRPWSEFPPTLEAEVAAYLEAAGELDLLGDGPARRPIRPRTRQNRDWQLRQAATALVEAGHTPDSLTGLQMLVEPEAVKAIARFLVAHSRNGSKAAASLTCSVLRIIARDWLKVPSDQVGKLDDICQRVSYSQSGMTEQNMDRLRPFDDPVNLRRLLLLPGQLVAEAEAAEPDEQSARLVQTALAIELALVAPMRPGNLVALDLEANIRRTRNHAKGQVHLVVPARSVKNKVDLDYPLPEDSVRLLDLYCSKFRPLLMAKSGTGLFPGDKGGSKTQRALSQQVVGAIRDRLGLDLNLHLFRHLAAKIYLDHNPGGYEVVRRVLGHQSMRTTTTFYAGMETAAAVRHFDQTVLNLRAAVPAPKQGGRR